MSYFITDSEAASSTSTGRKEKTAYRRVSGLVSGRRYFSPEISRWTSRDPIEEQGGYNVYAFCVNSPLVYVDAIGLYECRSEGFAARDPWWLMYGHKSQSDNSSSCEASISHWGVALYGYGQYGPEAICNSSASEVNTHLRIEARSPCCRKYKVTCLFSYSATVWNSNPGKPNRATGINLPVSILGETHRWEKDAKPGSTGIWQANLVQAMVRTKTIEIDSSWQILFNSVPGITAGTRAGYDGGPWIGAGFAELFAASCSLTDVGACD